MPPVPILRPRDALRAFEKLGWRIVRQRGSHIILTKPGYIATLSVLTTLPSPEERFVALSREPA
ncbi:MAG: type II toxin-antitoxin system HicA family toxin [Terriglobia bacterium]